MASFPESDPSQPTSRVPIQSVSAHPWVIVCWVTVLTLIGVVQVMRQQWFDTGLFFAAAVITAIGPRLPGRTVRQGPLSATTVAGLVAVGMVLSLLPRHGGWIKVALLVVGVGVVVFAWPAKSPVAAKSQAPSCSSVRSNAAPAPVSRSPRWTGGLRQLGILWTAMFLAGCLWELSQFILGYLAPDQPSYALSDLLNPLLESLPGQAVFVAAWLAGGVFLLRRGTARGGAGWGGR